MILWWGLFFIWQKYHVIKFRWKTLNFITLQLQVDLSESFRDGCYRWILCIEGSISSFGYSLLGPRRTAESVMTKFGFIRSGKRWDLLEEDSKKWNNRAIKRPWAAASTSEFFLFWRVNELQRWLKTSYAFKFFRSMFSSLIFIY